MKRIYTALACGATLLAMQSCVATYYPQDATYITISSNDGQDGKEVNVQVDGSSPINIKIPRMEQVTKNGNVYYVNSGINRVTVSQNGNVVYTEDIDFSQQNPKVIIVP